MSKQERDFQKEVIQIFKRALPGCIVLKLDPSYIQGIPDLLILNGNTWAALECKKEETSSHRPNQDHYISRMNDMSYAAFIYPENLQRILWEVISYFKYMSTIKFDYQAYEEWKEYNNVLQNLINSYKYDEVAAY